MQKWLFVPGVWICGVAGFGVRRVLRRSLLPAVMMGVALDGRSAVSQDVPTWHVDNARSGVQAEETVLTPANVRSPTFGKVFSLPVSGDVYAEPLFLAGYTMADGKAHNVLFVATQQDYVYAFDADGNNPAQGYLWRRSLLGGNETWVSSNDVNTTDITPDIGITGTPVIDRASGTMYVVAKSKTTSATPQFFQRLHAIRLTDGTETLNGPTTIAAAVKGTGDGGTTVSFSPLLNNQRPALLLAAETAGGSAKSVVISWASHGDNGQYHGWVIAYDASDVRKQTGVWTDTPNGSQGGIWMSGGGPASDDAGNVFLADGNGTFDANTGAPDFGDSALLLQFGKSGWTEAAYFTPADQSSLDAVDNDMGTAAMLLLPRRSGPVGLAVTADKTGMIYLLDRDNLGGFATPNDSSLENFSNGGYSVHNSFAYFNDTLFGAPDGGPLQAWTYQREFVRFVTSPQAQSSNTFGCVGCDGGGSTPTVSADRTKNGIVWALDNSGYGSGPAVLHAYDPANVATEFYNSTEGANSRDAAAVAVKFTTPTIAQGKVYVGGRDAITVYGLLSKGAPAATPVFSLGSGTYAGSQTVSLTDKTADASIYYTVQGATSTVGPLLYSGPIAVTATETIEATALAPGTAESATAEATYTIGPPTPPAGETVVSLTAVFNTVGMFSDGIVSSFPGLDGQGSAFSAQVLGTYLKFSGVEYVFGAANANDAVMGGTKAIAVPAGKYASLHVLATAVNGNQLQQTFMVTYTDGSKKTFLQDMSDWFTPQQFPGEVVAVASPYRDLNTGAEDNRTFNLYAYTLAVDSSKTVKSLTLPVNTSVAMFAVTAATK